MARTFLITMYICLGTLLSLWVSSHASGGGRPLKHYLPADSAIIVYASNPDDLWRAVENHNEFHELFNDPEWRRIRKTQKGWQKFDQDLAKARAGLNDVPAFLRDRIWPTHENWRFLLGNEMAFVVQVPPASIVDTDGKRRRKKPPGLILGHLEGWRGTLARIVLNLPKKKDDAKFFDLGGGTFALGFNGGRPGEGLPASDPLTHTQAKGAALDIAVRFHALWKNRPIDWREILPGDPRLREALGLESLPEEVRLAFRADTDSTGTTVVMEGDWLGDLPKHEPPAPMIDAPLKAGEGPMLDLVLPVDMRPAFALYLANQMNSRKGQRRWAVRMARLDEASVDLTRDLWPAFGHSLRATILPTAEGSASKQPRVLLSLPYRGGDVAHQALDELCAVLWKGLYTDKVPRKAKTPYVRRFEDGDTYRYVLLKRSGANFTAPLWRTGNGAFAATDDAGPFALTPMAPQLNANAHALDDPDSLIFRLTSDGRVMADSVAALTQLYLEELRDDIGAAKFLERYPDEGAIMDLARKTSRYAGRIHLEMRTHSNPSGTKSARIIGKWRYFSPLRP